MAGSCEPVSRYRFSNVSSSVADEARSATFNRDGAWSGNINVRSSNAANGSNRRSIESATRMITVVTAAIPAIRSTATAMFGAGGTTNDSTNAATTDSTNGTR